MIADRGFMIAILLLQLLKENITTFVEDELKTIQRRLSCDGSESLKAEEEKEKEFRGSREAFLKITVDFLRRMKQEGLADYLQSGEENLGIFFFCFFLSGRVLTVSRLSRRPSGGLSAPAQRDLKDKVPESVRGGR